MDGAGRFEDPIYKIVGQDISMTHVLGATVWKLWGKLLDLLLSEVAFGSGERPERRVLDS